MAKQTHKHVMSAELAFQKQILPEVSRTFALTIPQLPEPLSDAVGNAYLLCRIADTIEDEAGLPTPEKVVFQRRFAARVEGDNSDRKLASDLSRRLTKNASSDERLLLKQLDKVVGLTHQFPGRIRNALSKCVSIMSNGMAGFQARTRSSGLEDQPEMDRYCYYVAGVVGEMLTELFSNHSKDIDDQYQSLMKLAPSFGQGLQMTNILKDIWEDQQRGMCWLPSSVFERHGFDPDELKKGASHCAQDAGFVAGMRSLLSLANQHLNNALEYTLLIPARHRGIRQFCLWALGMAVMTLRKIQRNPGYDNGQDVKISRRTVKWVIAASNAFVGNDRALRWIYRLSSRTLRRNDAGNLLLPDYSLISHWRESIDFLLPETRIEPVSLKGG